MENDAFSISIAKNTSFDKRKNPYKFNFKAVEPEETNGSCFEILPKQVTVASRSF